ncbi:MAG: DUF1801 domain-containing protein [Bacillota bacterium]|nr:DUF1801 domain-containing protein [Bacillota bacterium]
MTDPIEEYIAQYPEEVAKKLQKLRNIIRETAPNSTEKIAWGTPAYYQNGFLVQFAAAKKHIGFFSSPGTLERFQEALTDYKTNRKNTLQLPLDREIPEETIAAMVKFRIQENNANKRDRTRYEVPPKS